MNITRKILAIIMSISMLLAVPVSAYTDDDKIVQKKAVAVVSALRIMKGYEEGAFSPEKPVTRAEFAQIISLIYGIGANGASSNWVSEFFENEKTELELKVPQPANKERFDDVLSDHWAYEAIKGITNFGIMRGVSDTLFDPDRTITYQEAVKALISVLGYSTKADIKGGYPTGYMTLAAELKLLNGINLGTQEPLSREQIARIVYNALDVDFLQCVSFGEIKKYEVIEGDTILSKLLDVGVIKGQMTANDTTTLTSESNIGRNKVVISGAIYELTDKTAYVSSLIGYEIEAYYSIQKNSDIKTILYATATDSSKSITIEAENINSFLDNKLEYDDGDNIKSVKIVPGAPMIYNGLTKTTYDSDTFNFDIGNVTLIDSGSGNYDTIIIKDYRTYVVSGVDKSDCIIYNKADDGNSATDDDFIVVDTNDSDYRITIVSSEGQPLDFSQIKTDDVLSVMKNGRSIYIIVCNKTVNATISELQNDERNTVVVADDKRYIIANDYMNAANKTSFSVGDAGTIYLDAFGRLAWFVTGVKTGLTTAYLIKSDLKSDSFGPLQIEIFGADSKVKVLDVADKVTINDENGISQSYGYESALTALNARKGAIRYTVNSNGLVNLIEIPLNTQDEQSGNRLYKLFETTETTMSNYTYKTGAKTFGGKVYLNDSTIIVSKPSNADDEKKYTLLKASGFGNDKNYAFTAYGTIPNSPLAQVLVVQDIVQVISPTDLAVVVTNIKSALDKNGENVIKVSGIQGTNAVELLVEESNASILENANDMLNSKDASNVLNTYKVKVGDIIKYTNDVSTGYVNKIQIVFIADGINPASPDGVSGCLAGSIGTYTSDIIYKNYCNPFVINDAGDVIALANKFTQGAARVLYGFAYSNVFNMVAVTTQDLSVNSYDRINGGGKWVTDYYAASLFKITTVEYTKNKVTAKAGSVADIKTYKEVGASCSRIIAITRYGDATQLIVINGSRD